MKRRPSHRLVIEVTHLTDEDQELVADWIRSGMIYRFVADPTVSVSDDDLLVEWGDVSLT